MRHRRRLIVFTLALAWLTLTVQATRELEAHPLGLTRATVTFTPDRRYTIDILVDPESLLTKLEVLAGGEPSGAVPPAELPARIRALQTAVLANAHVTFDGRESAPAFAYIPDTTAAADTRASSVSSTASTSEPTPTGPTAPTATIRLTGDVPEGAARFRFNYGLVLGSYVLTVTRAASRGNTGSDGGGSGGGGARGSGSPVTLWVAGGQDSEPIDLTHGLIAPSRFAVARTYLVLGFEHILPKGLDHILFVLGIFLLSTAWRPILLQVTTFTIAHSITLGLTMYGIVSLPSSIVEPLIALSITYVAVENLWTTELKPWRLALVFTFGLLHGMGFAGVLRELGLPRSEFLTALLTFNLGVEAGQLAVIAIALAIVGWWRRRESARYRQWVVVPASVVIALVGAYWTVTRAIG